MDNNNVLEQLKDKLFSTNKDVESLRNTLNQKSFWFTKRSTGKHMLDHWPFGKGEFEENLENVITEDFYGPQFEVAKNITDFEDMFDKSKLLEDWANNAAVTDGLTEGKGVKAFSLLANGYNTKTILGKLRDIDVNQAATRKRLNTISGRKIAAVYTDDWAKLGLSEPEMDLEDFGAIMIADLAVRNPILLTEEAGLWYEQDAPVNYSAPKLGKKQLKQFSNMTNIENFDDILRSIEKRAKITINTSDGISAGDVTLTKKRFFSSLRGIKDYVRRATNTRGLGVPASFNLNISSNNTQGEQLYMVLKALSDVSVDSFIDLTEKEIIKGATNLPTLEHFQEDKDTIRRMASCLIASDICHMLGLKSEDANLLSDAFMMESFLNMEKIKNDEGQKYLSLISSYYAESIHNFAQDFKIDMGKFAESKGVTLKDGNLDSILYAKIKPRTVNTFGETSARLVNPHDYDFIFNILNSYSATPAAPAPANPTPAGPTPAAPTPVTPRLSAPAPAASVAPVTPAPTVPNPTAVPAPAAPRPAPNPIPVAPRPVTPVAPATPNLVTQKPASATPVALAAPTSVPSDDSAPITPALVAKEPNSKPKDVDAENPKNAPKTEDIETLDFDLNKAKELYEYIDYLIDNDINILMDSFSNSNKDKTMLSLDGVHFYHVDEKQIIYMPDCLVGDKLVEGITFFRGIGCTKEQVNLLNKYVNYQDSIKPKPNLEDSQKIESLEEFYNKNFASNPGQIRKLLGCSLDEAFDFDNIYFLINNQKSFYAMIAESAKDSSLELMTGTNKGNKLTYKYYYKNHKLCTENCKPIRFMIPETKEINGIFCTLPEAKTYEKVKILLDNYYQKYLDEKSKELDNQDNLGSGVNVIRIDTASKDKSGEVPGIISADIPINPTETLAIDVYTPDKKQVRNDKDKIDIVNPKLTKKEESISKKEEKRRVSRRSERWDKRNYEQEINEELDEYNLEKRRSNKLEKNVKKVYELEETKKEKDTDKKYVNKGANIAKNFAKAPEKTIIPIHKTSPIPQIITIDNPVIEKTTQDVLEKQNIIKHYKTREFTGEDFSVYYNRLNDSFVEKPEVVARLLGCAIYEFAEYQKLEFLIKNKETLKDMIPEEQKNNKFKVSYNNHKCIFKDDDLWTINSDGKDVEDLVQLDGVNCTKVEAENYTRIKNLVYGLYKEVEEMRRLQKVYEIAGTDTAGTPDDFSYLLSDVKLLNPGPNKTLLKQPEEPEIVEIDDDTEVETLEDRPLIDDVILLPAAESKEIKTIVPVDEQPTTMPIKEKIDFIDVGLPTDMKGFAEGDQCPKDTLRACEGVIIKYLKKYEKNRKDSIENLNKKLEDKNLDIMEVSDIKEEIKMSEIESSLSTTVGGMLDNFYEINSDQATKDFMQSKFEKELETTQELELIAESIAKKVIEFKEVNKNLLPDDITAKSIVSQYIKTAGGVAKLQKDYLKDVTEIVMNNGYFRMLGCEPEEIIAEEIVKEPSVENKKSKSTKQQFLDDFLK